MSRNIRNRPVFASRRMAVVVTVERGGSRSRRWLKAREVQLPLNVEAPLEMTREALSSFAVEMGLKVAQCLLADEVTQCCGQRHERVANRSEMRFGHQRGFIMIAGQKVSVDKPRVRYTDDRGKRNSSGTSSCNRQKPCRKLRRTTW